MTAPDISREACERLRVRLKTVPLYHSHGETADLPEEAADIVVALRAALDAAERERDGANALVERMHAQDVLAIQAWQKANPGQGLVWPSSIRLSAWCMGEVAKLSAERDAADATGYARGVRDAAEAARSIPACPFDQEACELDPETPCPVCGDLGTWDDENLARVSNCMTPAAAIIALLPATEKDTPDDR